MLHRIFITTAIVLVSIGATTSCGLLGPRDETADAAKLVQEANKELTEIKKIYKENEGDDEKPGLRESIKKALVANDAAQVKILTGKAVDSIGDGMTHARTAIEKIQEAQALNVNPDYNQYLNYKELSLTKQVEAFEQYRQAARALRDNYDPNNEELRKKVAIEFDQRSDQYRKLMEDARDFSSYANEIAKDALQRSMAK